MIPSHDDPYAKLDPVPRAEIEPGLKRLRAWQGLGWNLEEVQAAINRRDVDKLIGHLLSVWPTYIADALTLLGVPPIDPERGIQAQHRIDESVSDCVEHAREHLRSLLATKRTPQLLANYYRQRCKSIVRETIQEMSCQVGKLKRSPLEGNDRPARPPRYEEATTLMAGLAMRMAPDDLRFMLTDIFKGRHPRDAVHLEAQRRKKLPAYPRTNEHLRAGILRQIAILGAAVAAAAPDWALDSWFQQWGGRLSWMADDDQVIDRWRQEWGGRLLAA